MPTQTNGIGSALRQARERRSKTIEEASRDTKIREDFLKALEGEDFEELSGEVYVRGFLRSYSQYLGLDPDKVVSSYAKNAGDLEPPPAPPEERRADRREVFTFRTGQRTASLVLAGGVALVLLVVAGALGLLSSSRATPPAADLPVDVPVLPAAPRAVTVLLVANHEVNATIMVDGVEEFSGTLRAKEGRAFTGVDSINVTFARGGVVTLKTNGEDLGTPGQPTQPYSATFYPKEPRSPSARRESPSPALP